MSDLEETLLLHIRADSLPEPVREHRFHKTRKWRFDFAWPAAKLAVEVEGGTWCNGRHNRGSGFTEDCEKYNAAAVDGWVVLRFTKAMIDSGYALSVIRTCLMRKGMR